MSGAGTRRAELTLLSPGARQGRGRRRTRATRANFLGRFAPFAPNFPPFFGRVFQGVGKRDENTKVENR